MPGGAGSGLSRVATGTARVPLVVGTVAVVVLAVAALGDARMHVGAAVVAIAATLPRSEPQPVPPWRNRPRRRPGKPRDAVRVLSVGNAVAVVIGAPFRTLRPRLLRRDTDELPDPT